MAEEKKPEAAAAVPAPETKKAGAPDKKGGKGKLGIIIGMTIFGGSVWFIFPSLLLLIGMLPTVLELFFGNDRKGSSVVAIGALNAAGILPFLIELWQKGQTTGNAILILSQPTTWLVMFGAAAVGWLILFAVPQAAATLTLARAETRVQLLKHNLERLKEVWGPEVATTKPLEKIAKGE